MSTVARLSDPISSLSPDADLLEAAQDCLSALVDAPLNVVQRRHETNPSGRLQLDIDIKERLLYEEEHPSSARPGLDAVLEHVHAVLRAVQ